MKVHSWKSLYGIQWDVRDFVVAHNIKKTVFGQDQENIMMREHLRFHRRALSQKAHVLQWATSPLALGLWVIVSLLLSVSLWRSMRSMQQSLSREQQEKEHLAQEEQRALELIDKLNKADTPFAKEKIIRDELQMQKPGETVLQIPRTSP